MWRIFHLCCQDEPTPIDRNKRIVPKIVAIKQIEQLSGNILPPKSDFQSTIKFKRTNRYEGEELAGKPHGNGSMLYANGDFYRGEWVNGIKEGRGLQIYQEQGMQYEGEWQNDEPNGNGKLLHPNNSYYIGEFKNGVQHGNGQFFDNEKKKFFNREYENGQIKTNKEVEDQNSREEQFPTLVLDKERFNTEDLNQFQDKNPEIKQFDLFFLLKYYGLCKIRELEFINKSIKQWSIKEVIDFLKMIKMEQYMEIFYNNRVKGKDLLSLNEKQLKEDLRMKMGDRKRLLNYRTFLNQLQMNNSKELKSSKNSSNKKNYNFRPTKTMKNVKKLNSKPLYDQSMIQSIIEECQSDSQSQKQRNKNRARAQQQDKQQQQQQMVKYGSVAEKYYPRTYHKYASLQQKLEPESDKCINNSGVRKQSKDLINDLNSNNNNNYQLMKIESKHELQEQSRKRESDQRKQQNKQKESSGTYKSSSSDSDQSIKELTRKKTEVKPHQTTEIRELYQFLKNHRTLQFLIKQKDIQKLQLIGQGGYGKVYKGKYIGQLIAIKDYLKTGKHRHKEDFMKQVEIISDLKHPNIVLYMGMCITANKYTLITEYMENGSLFDQIHNKKKKFTQVQKIQIAYEIVKGMVYLHNMKKILHRDLKSSNVLIGQDWNVVKLCDFGLSAQQKKKQKKHKRVGTYQWMAPQVIRNQQKIDEFADVYSFGVIIWELLSQKVPYQGLSENQVIGLVGYDPDHQLDVENTQCQFLRHLMKKCLKKSAIDRPSFMQIQIYFEERFEKIAYLDGN